MRALKVSVLDCPRYYTLNAAYIDGKCRSKEVNIVYLHPQIARYCDILCYSSINVEPLEIQNNYRRFDLSQLDQISEIKIRFILLHVLADRTNKNSLSPLYCCMCIIIVRLTLEVDKNHLRLVSLDLMRLCLNTSIPHKLLYPMMSAYLRTHTRFTKLAPSLNTMPPFLNNNFEYFQL